MFRSILGALVVAVVAMPLMADEPKDKPKDKGKKLDSSKLVGTWTYVSGMRAGKKVGKESLMGNVVITKDTLTMPAGPEAKFVIGYKIDNSTSPAKIEMSIKDGPVKEGKASGLITLKGKRLILCYVAAPGDAPKKMKSTEENNAFYFVLKRAKKE